MTVDHMNAVANVLMALAFLVAGLPVLIKTLHEVRWSRVEIRELRDEIRDERHNKDMEG